MLVKGFIGWECYDQGFAKEEYDGYVLKGFILFWRTIWMVGMSLVRIRTSSEEASNVFTQSEPLPCPSTSILVSTSITWMKA